MISYFRCLLYLQISNHPACTFNFLCASLFNLFCIQKNTLKNFTTPDYKVYNNMAKVHDSITAIKTLDKTTIY